jgi:general secretion pathway protein J
MKPMTFHRKITGFTLIEVIVSMTILSLILVLLFSTLFTANQNWQLTKRNITQNDDIRLISNFIRRQIIQNIPLLWIDKKEQRLIFNGKKNELNFTSTLPAHRGGGGIQILSLRVNRTDDAHHLDLYYRYANPDKSPFDEWSDEKHTTLLDNIKNIELSYYGQEKINEDSVWRDEWQNKEVLPTLINLKIITVNEDLSWPEITIPLHTVYIKGQPQFVLRRSQNNSI